MTYLGNNEAQKGYLHSLGTELRGLRERAGYTCEFVAAALNPEQPSRDRISKLERGISGIDQYDYLRLMWFYRDVAPDHPAVDLAKRLLPRDALLGQRSQQATRSARKRRETD